MRVVIALTLALSIAGTAEPQTSQRSFLTVAKEADQARQADHLNEAISLYSEGVRQHASWKEGWWWLGSLLYDQDRFSEALQAFGKFVKLDAHSGPGYAFLALCEYEVGEYAEALRHFQAWSAERAPGSDALLDVAGFHWALLLTRNGQFNEALYLLSAKGKKLGPVPALIEAMGLASLRMASLPEEYPADKREAVWLAGMSTYYFSENERDRSKYYVERLALHYDRLPSVHYLHGTQLAFLGECDPAIQEFQKELQISVDHAPALTEWAICRVQEGQPEAAITLASWAVARDPQNARAHYALGRALLETGAYEKSAEQLEIAKRLAPDSARIRFVLSTAYKRLGRTSDSDREAAAFEALKDKEEVLAPLEEKLKSPKDSGPRP